ncbi:MAG: hypothetical protein GYB67_11500, partial [Chloroflexi bacterium]|nr:hypothetical protein [Chloroflexota bacterium]
MAWPNPNEYLEALQNPQAVFSDPALRAGRVITDRLGLPRPISGNFAVVFQVETGGKTWAVRCFLRETTDQEQRYAGISRHLAAHRPDYTVGFAYQPQGIRLRGQWYPILKMEWVKGQRLDTHIETLATRSDRAGLETLSRRWGALMAQLRSDQIAHGDLQHGNIVVDEHGQIKLIDYDGMVVPSLAHLRSPELGHRHYQHPTRTSGGGITPENFLNIDNFSAWVIGLSIRLLHIDPTLWQQTAAGDDRLLFAERDFKSLRGAQQPTQPLQLLQTHAQPAVQQAVQQLAELARQESYLRVAPFSSADLLNGAVPLPLPPTTTPLDLGPEPTSAAPPARRTPPAQRPDSLPELSLIHI